MSGQVRLTLVAALATALASLSLTPVLESGPWAGPVAATILVVALAGGTMRHLHAPRWAAVAVPAASLVLLLTVMFARTHAPFGILPGPAAWRSLESTFRSGIDVLWAQAPPVAATSGVSLIMAAAVGVVALAVDALAVTWRFAAVAGLPLLALYLIPAAVAEGGAPWLLFVITAVGWLMLLVADSRDSLRRWGRTLSMRQGPGGASPVDVALGSSSRRLGAAAVVTAVVIPFLVPFLTDGVFGHGNGAGDGKAGSAAAGLGQHGGLDPVAALRRDLSVPVDGVVLTYHSTDNSPAYFRVATLTDFDGSKWQLGQAHPVLVPAGPSTIDLPGVGYLPHAVRRQPVTTTVEISPTYRDSRLPLPLVATSVQGAGDGWVWDAQTTDVVAADPSRTTQALHYEVDSVDLAPTPRQLRRAGAADSPALTQVPAQTRQVLQPYVDRLGNQPTSFDQAMAIQNWLRTRFTYDVTVASTSGNTDDLGQFLIDRSGYCQQFAAVMALMARLSGIPARVVVGFTPGTPVDSDGQTAWQVKWHDAHAWPELWFDRIGWVRFEPTPPGQGGTGAGLPPWANPAVQATGHGPAGSPHPHVPTGGHLLPAEHGGHAGAGGTLATPAAPFDWTPWVVLGLVVGAVLLVTPAVTRRRIRRQRGRTRDPREQVEAAWAEVVDTASDLGLEPSPKESPRDLAARLGREGGVNASVLPAMRRLSLAVERVRYARDPGPIDDPWADAAVVCAALMTYAGPRRARRATWWPESARAHLRQRWQAATDRVDLVQGRATARLRRRTPSPV